MCVNPTEGHSANEAQTDTLFISADIKSAENCCDLRDTMMVAECINADRYGV